LEHKSRVKKAQALVNSARRIFLGQTAVTTIGATLATIVAATDKPASQSASKILSACTDLQAPMKEVASKVAFITGGSSGIGLGIARAFVDAGMKVVITYRTEKHREDAMSFLKTAGERVHAIGVDVTDRPGMERAAEETLRVFGKVHVLVNNAGVNNDKSLAETTYDDWDWLTNVNVNGVFNGVRTFLPRIQMHGEGGHIVTTSSVFGLLTTTPGLGPYTASKFAVVGMMEALRAELADTQIGVSVLCPGVVASTNIGVNRDRSLAENRSETLKERPKTPPESAMNPLDVGKLALRGIRNNDLYILTNPEYKQIMQERSEALIASLPSDLQTTHTNLALARAATPHSIYADARDHKHCPQAARNKEAK
jgi:NAD(P)-dependent dehydrogenase (short-subunit alcohol dehydrogenase family)